MQEFFIKQGDLLPAIESILKDENDVAIDLTSTTIQFAYRRYGETLATVRTAEIIAPATNGHVRYQWVTADTATAGSMEAEWRVTYPGGSVVSFPNDGYLIVRVSSKLA